MAIQQERVELVQVLPNVKKGRLVRLPVDEGRPIVPTIKQILVTAGQVLFGLFSTMMGYDPGEADKWARIERVGYYR